MDKVEFISCAPEALYGEARPTDEAVPLETLLETSRRHPGAIEVVGEVFPGGSVSRAPPDAILGPDDAFAEQLALALARTGNDYARYAPALLTRVREAIVWNNMVFSVADGCARPIYEFYRPVDRAEKGEHLVARLAACHERKRLDLERPLFVGSAGSFNYGHWLVDDFPSLAAARVLPDREPITDVLMSSYDPSIDRTRSEGTSMALGQRESPRIHLLDRHAAYRVRDVLYVTPVSYHPIVKNPHALDYVRSVYDACLFDAPSFARTDRIFVNRGDQFYRNLLNGEEVRRILASAGFSEFFPERYSLREQWATFAHAREVVGIMGAGMTNCVLCRPDTKVTYLSPDGWVEYFFWDLACMSRHRYVAIFGVNDGSSPHAFRNNFSVPPDLLMRGLDLAP